MRDARMLALPGGLERQASFVSSITSAGTVMDGRSRIPTPRLGALGLTMLTDQVRMTPAILFCSAMVFAAAEMLSMLVHTSHTGALVCCLIQPSTAAISCICLAFLRSVSSMPFR